MVSNWVEWTPKKRLQIGTEIYDKVNYKKILWTCGFIKTSTSSALFVIGFTLIFNGLTDHPLFISWNESAIFFGILAVIIALLVIYIIDKKRELMKKEEFGREQENIERRIYESKNQNKEELNELIHCLIDQRISETVYEQLEYMNRLQEEGIDGNSYDGYDLTEWEKDVYTD